jgi:hypothetical protein
MGGLEVVRFEPMRVVNFRAMNKTPKRTPRRCWWSVPPEEHPV